MKDKPEVCRDCPTFENECEGSNQEDCERRGRPELREKIYRLLKCPPLKQDCGHTAKDWSAKCYPCLLDQIFLLYPDEEEIRKDAIQKEREWMASNQYRDEQLEQAKREEKERIISWIKELRNASANNDDFCRFLFESIKVALKKGD